MDYVQDIQPIEEGKTDAEIATALQATGVTVSKIDRATLMDLLNKLYVLRKVVRSGEAAIWKGSALEMQSAIVGSGNTVFINAFDEWFSHITNPTNVSWDTTKPQWATPFWQMAQTFADAPTMPTAADFQAIADLGGGWKFADATAQQVTDTRQAYLDQQAASARRALALAEMQRLRETVAPAKIDAAKVAYQNADYSLDIDHAAAVKAAFDAVIS